MNDDRVDIELGITTDTGSATRFEPAELNASPSDSVRVRFVNRSRLPHNITFRDPIDVASRTIVEPGTRDAVVFVAPEPGRYVFGCTIHEDMEGVLVVS